MRSNIVKKLKRSFFVQMMFGTVLALVAISFVAPLFGIDDKDVMAAVATVMALIWVIFKLPDISEE